MPTNYTGNPTAAQAPSPAPSLDVDPIGALVTDTDAQAAASYIHPQKVALDWIAFLRREVRKLNRTIVEDHFTGSVVGTDRWITSGSPTVVDDSANGANGSCQLVGASSQSISIKNCAFGTSDFKFEAHIRVSGVTSSTNIIVGVGNVFVNGLSFYIAGSVSTTYWGVSIDNVATAPNGTPVAISSGYVTLELTRTSNAVTFKINGTTLHTIASYTTSLTPGSIFMNSAISGILFIDYVRFQLLS
jgi:hypothetical protein